MKIIKNTKDTIFLTDLFLNRRIASFSKYQQPKDERLRRFKPGRPRNYEKKKFFCYQL